MLNRFVSNMLPYMPKKLVWEFSKRYIAGETLEEGLLVSKLLNQQKIEVTVDLLGEFIKNLTEATRHKNNYLEIISHFTEAEIAGNFSLKPTMFGLLIDREACYSLVREIVSFAAKRDGFVRIDMEDSQCVDFEIELFRELHKEFPEHVGLVLQSYLRRTAADLEALSELNSDVYPLNFRLCKGIYIEPEEIAYTGYDEVRSHFLQNLESMFQHRMYVGIATHDRYLIEQAFQLIQRYRVPSADYEFQMLYGVTPELRQWVIDQGHRMRVYVPFGKEWFNYCTRRLKENPKIVQHIIKALFVRG